MTAVDDPDRSRGARRPLRWVEPWYAAYGLDGLVLLGVGPILVPLTVERAGPGAVGAVVAAFYVGALFTPLAGSIADRTGRQRTLFLACFPVMAVTMVAFAAAHVVWQWALLAAAFGGAGAVAGTMGGMFIVEAHPKAEWNHRIAWFRLAYGAGQVVGLVLAAFAATHLRAGWWITAAAVLVAWPLGRLGLPHLSARTASDRGELGADPSASARQVAGISWVLHAYHRPRFGELWRAMDSRFGLFVVTWLLTMLGLQTFFNVVPLVMRAGFGVSPSASSIAFMVGAVVGTAIFPALGALASRIGPGRVLGIGLAISAASFGAMALLDQTDPSWKAGAALVALVTAAVAYSFEVVAATMLTARLTPFSEGSAMGVLNSAIAAGSIIGALVPSVVAARYGYGVLTLVATGVVVVALLVGLPLIERTTPTGDAAGAAS